MNDMAWLIDIMARLRHPSDGCPWDIQQTFETIAPYTIEEAYEVADAIEREDWTELRGELGDLLFQVVFYTQLGKEQGLFSFDDVAAGIADKLLRRHPHVFGDVEEHEASGVRDRWEDIKEQERADHDDQSALAAIAKALPALKRAQKLGKRAARVGFDWPDRWGVRRKIEEELGELEQATGEGQAAAIEEELGDLLFAVVNLARHLDVDAEHALAGANHKFERRFRAMEAAIGAEGLDIRALDLESLEQRWLDAKKNVG